MKHPVTARVGPYLVRICWDEELLDPEHDGVFEGGKLRIVVNPSLAVPVQRSVLLHELLHASVFLGHDDAIKDEESAISVLQTPLLTILRDNPKIVAWLTEADK